MVVVSATIPIKPIQIAAKENAKKKEIINNIDSNVYLVLPAVQMKGIYKTGLHHHSLITNLQSVPSHLQSGPASQCLFDFFDPRRKDGQTNLEIS